MLKIRLHNGVIIIFFSIIPVDQTEPHELLKYILNAPQVTLDTIYKLIYTTASMFVLLKA